MSKQKSYIGTCVFCGATGDVTDDHVPPKPIFAKPRPSDLITVPGCEECDHGWSLDDEYFRTALCLSDKTTDDRNATSGREAAMRSLQRQEARDFAKMFLARTFPKEVYSPGGLYLGKRLVCKGSGRSNSLICQGNWHKWGLILGLYRRFCGQKEHYTRGVNFLLSIR
jgi:hypothetical protein